MIWSIIIAQIFVVAINLYLATTEDKLKIYIITFLFNFSNLIMYIVNGDKATTIVYIVISLRSFIYIFRDKFKTPIIPICVISCHLILGFFTIENVWQILSIVTPCFVCYYMWFWKTTQKLRVGNIINNTLWLIYNIHGGLYIVVIARLVTISGNLFNLIKNKKK